MGRHAPGERRRREARLPAGLARPLVSTLRRSKAASAAGGPTRAVRERHSRALGQARARLSPDAVRPRPSPPGGGGLADQQRGPGRCGFVSVRTLGGEGRRAGRSAQVAATRPTSAGSRSTGSHSCPLRALRTTACHFRRTGQDHSPGAESQARKTVRRASPDARAVGCPATGDLVWLRGKADAPNRHVTTAKHSYCAARAHAKALRCQTPCFGSDKGKRAVARSVRASPIGQRRSRPSARAPNSTSNSRSHAS